MNSGCYFSLSTYHVYVTEPGYYDADQGFGIRLETIIMASYVKTDVRYILMFKVNQQFVSSLFQMYIVGLSTTPDNCNKDSIFAASQEPNSLVTQPVVTKSLLRDMATETPWYWTLSRFSWSHLSTLEFELWFKTLLFLFYIILYFSTSPLVKLLLYIVLRFFVVIVVRKTRDDPGVWAYCSGSFWEKTD